MLAYLCTELFFTALCLYYGQDSLGEEYFNWEVLNKDDVVIRRIWCIEGMNDSDVEKFLAVYKQNNVEVYICCAKHEEELLSERGLSPNIVVDELNDLTVGELTSAHSDAVNGCGDDFDSLDRDISYNLIRVMTSEFDAENPPVDLHPPFDPTSVLWAEYIRASDRWLHSNRARDSLWMILPERPLVTENDFFLHDAEEVAVFYLRVAPVARLQYDKKTQTWDDPSGLLLSAKDGIQPEDENLFDRLLAKI